METRLGSVNKKSSHRNLYSLPNEILCQIISSLDIGGVKSFMETCKKFYELADNQVLWKSRALKSASPAIRMGMLENCDGDWYNCLKQFTLLKNYIVQEICKAHEKYEGVDLLNSIKPLYDFITPVLHKKCDLYYSINILIDLYREAYQNAKEFGSIYVFNVMPTDLYYIKIHLAFLTHTYLITKWGHADAFDLLLPETVLHFTIQWLNYTTFYVEEENQKLFDNLAIEVENLLWDKHPLKQVLPENRKVWSTKALEKNMWPSDDCKQVLSAVSQVVYKNGLMTVTEDVNLDTIDVQKIWKNDVASVVSLFVIYEAVARRCGVLCKLMVDDEILLQWKDSVTNDSFTINELNGSLQQSNPYEAETEYCPTEHVHYIMNFITTDDEIQVYRGEPKIITFVNGGNEGYNYYNFISLCNKTYLTTHIKNEYNIKQMDAAYLLLIRTCLTLRELTGPSNASNTRRLIPI